MKKLSMLVAGFLSLCVITQAHAKTEGSYWEVNAVKSRGFADRNSYNGSKFDVSTGDPTLYKIHGDSQISGGIGLKYAFNFNHLFIAPGLLADYNNLSMRDSDHDEWRLGYRYGAKVDLGFDIGDRLAIYASTGLANNYYQVNWNSLSMHNKGHSWNQFYGFGIKYSLAENMDLGLNYEFYKMAMQEPKIPLFAQGRTDMDIRLLRLGLAFKF